MDNIAMTLDATPFARVRFARPEGNVLAWGTTAPVQGTAVSADRSATTGLDVAIAGDLAIAPNTQRYTDVAHVRTGEPPV